ncbi:MAG: hypothetical protein IKZ53_05815 [Selenomonadaceae bacterium]|nr:hypothetical protein [Selenomonadaceae bacterium]
MTEQEKINENIQRQIDAQNARIDNVLTKVDMLVIEAQQQREDMRRLQDRQDAMQAKHDAEMQAMNKKIDDKFESLMNQIHNNFVQTMVGFGAIAAAVGGLVVAAFK